MGEGQMTQNHSPKCMPETETAASCSVAATHCMGKLAMKGCEKLF